MEDLVLVAYAVVAAHAVAVTAESAADAAARFVVYEPGRHSGVAPSGPLCLASAEVSVCPFPACCIAFPAVADISDSPPSGLRRTSLAVEAAEDPWHVLEAGHPHFRCAAARRLRG